MSGQVKPKEALWSVRPFYWASKDGSNLGVNPNMLVKANSYYLLATSSAAVLIQVDVLAAQAISFYRRHDDKAIAMLRERAGNIRANHSSTH
jgi:hypothetical protein